MTNIHAHSFLGSTVIYIKELLVPPSKLSLRPGTVCLFITAATGEYRVNSYIPTRGPKKDVGKE